MVARNRRMQRVDELLRQEIARLIAIEVKDPRVGFVTVVDARVSADLRHARVYVSVLGDEEEKLKTLDALQRAGGFLRRRLGRLLDMKYQPELRFELDRGVERAARLEEILDRIRPEDDAPEGAP